MTYSYDINYCNLINYIDINLNSNTDMCKNIFYNYLLFTLWYLISIYVIVKTLHEIYNVVIYNNVNNTKHRCNYYMNGSMDESEDNTNEDSITKDSTTKDSINNDSIIEDSTLEDNSTVNVEEEEEVLYFKL